MSKDVLRLSQIVGAFGPGAMVDLPDRSVMISGLDSWGMGTKGAFRPIDEGRLIKLLEERLRGDRRIAQDRPLSLRTPPIDPGGLGGRPGPGVPATVFAAWFTCDTVEADPALDGGTSASSSAGTTGHRRRRMVEWTNLEPPARKKYRDDGGKAHDVTPLRFVCGCPNGHLQDIPWRWVVHGDTQCSGQPLWLEETGTSGDPRDTKILCGCGASLMLEQLFQAGRLGTCRGERPWIGDRDPEGCKDDAGKSVNLKLLPRSATNAYFPQVATVISVPEADDKLGRRVTENLSDLRELSSAFEVAIARKSNQGLRAALEGYSDDAVFARLEQLKSGDVAATAPDPRALEYEVLASGRELIGEDSSDALLHAATLARSDWDSDGNPLLAGIEALVAVHRLREVVCLYGFTRFQSAPPISDDGLEDVGIAVRGAPLGSNPDWLPAIEQHGEGLFVQISAPAIDAWLTRTATKKHVARLMAGFNHWEKAKPGLRARSGVYAMLHSLSHALMMEIALDCGYPASSLRERVYALAAKPGVPMRCGLLIYTATAGTQGTLGGLVEVADRFAVVLEGALRRLEVCSSDPVCADHDPVAHADDRATHGAACHGCLLIAETSCEARNLFLDRALLVETMAEPGAAFFELG